MREAMFYRALSETGVECLLCPRKCRLRDGAVGACRVRINRGGKLYTGVYGRCASIAVDPIEKKPLFHFYPGKKILSLGTVGCNLHCLFCQNYSISQQSVQDTNSQLVSVLPQQIVDEALEIPGNIGIAYTYNEPFVFYEFMLDTARLAKNRGLANVVVTNGYLELEPLKELLPWVDAFNVDLKAFDEGFYRRLTGGHLEPVLDTLKEIGRSQCHLEITNLIIPGENDDKNRFLEMVKWISRELGPDIPLHISRYFPLYQFSVPPTSVCTIETFYELAKRYLNYVYAGNLPKDELLSTYCPNCGQLLIARNYRGTEIVGIAKNATCSFCGCPINVSVPDVTR